MTNYMERILRGLADAPDTIACHLPDGSSLTRGEIAAQAHRTAQVLAAHGVRQGVTVTMLSGNRIEALTARYATSILGGRAVHLYEGLAAATQAAIVSDVDTQVLLVDDNWATRGAEVLALAPVPKVLTFGPCGYGADLGALATDETPVPVAEVAEEELWGIRHTGGTTGHPKGIMLDHRSQHAVFDFQELVIPAGSVYLACSTLAHRAGAVIDTILCTGGRFVLHERFDAGRALAAIERYRISYLFLMPPLLYQLMDHPDRAGTDLSSLRSITYGGCPSSPSRIARALELFGSVLVHGYGQNEAGGIAALPLHQGIAPELLSSVGRAAPGVALEVRDESGQVVRPGVRGEICVRSAMSGTGYWRNPELTARVWRAGWVHTGDIGYLDQQGNLFLCDRLKDIIIVVGGHVYPSELEEVLMRHPAVAQAAVFGRPDADAVERVHAAVVPRAGHQVDLAMLREFVTEQHGALYAPHSLSIVDNIPLTDAAKPDKKLLREQL